jgi:hypothetical protein
MKAFESFSTLKSTKGSPDIFNYMNIAFSLPIISDSLTLSVTSMPIT